MLQLPTFYKNYDRSPLDLDIVYKALRNKDVADCVVLATKVLKQTKTFTKLESKEKSASEALQHRKEGKKAFCEGEYQLALVKYNMALMQAPLNSEAMRLSYYSRAELLFKTKQFSACVKDIETCLALDCNVSLINKLQKMKAEACRCTWIEQLERMNLSTPFAEEFFKLKGSRNPDIPYATSDVEIVMESGKPKVVAAKDIPVGTVVAVETAFVGATNIMNHITSCHYCFKMDFNLIPCEGCCAAMFCDKQCKDKAMQEGHNFECKIIEIIFDDIKLPVKATLKIRQLCSSWDEFITASKDLGVERMKNNTVAEIFGTQKFSLFNSHYDTHFIYGAMFNRCLYFANVIHYLDTCTSFLPIPPDEKSAAIQAVSRVLMHLSLYCTPVQMQHSTSVCTEGRTVLHNHPNRGYFPFIGSLPNSCLPNSYVVGLRNSAALVTIAPVKQGAELTFSYVGHWLEVVPSEWFMRAKKLFIHYRTVCEDCIICGGRADNIFLNNILNDTQMKASHKFSKYYSSPMRNFPQSIKSDYRETCNILQALGDAPCAKEYVLGHVSFVKCIMHCVQKTKKKGKTDCQLTEKILLFKELWMVSSVDSWHKFTDKYK